MILHWMLWIYIVERLNFLTFLKNCTMSWGTVKSLMVQFDSFRACFNEEIYCSIYSINGLATALQHKPYGVCSKCLNCSTNIVSYGQGELKWLLALGMLWEVFSFTIPGLYFALLIVFHPTHSLPSTQQRLREHSLRFWALFLYLGNSV